jgi:S-DNA-T family DNA segregation ATPase FtsK/SpoIIIE
LITLVYSIIKHHSADEANIYALDFGSETLAAFEQAPQVSGVLFAHDVEKIESLFKMLLREYNLRRKEFSQYGGDLQGYNKHSGQTMPNIIVIINNYAAFSEQFDIYEESFALLSRDGLKYGIVFVVTASSTAAIRWRIQQNFKQILTMQLNDESNYSVIFGKSVGIIPSAFKGRGLVSLYRVYEFQTAYSTPEDDFLSFLRNFSTELRRNSACFAKPVPMMPDLVTASTFKHIKPHSRAVPVGIAKDTLEPALYDFTAKAIHPILANDITVAGRFSQGLCEVLSSKNSSIIVLDVELVFSHCSTPPYRYVRDSFEPFIIEEFNDFVQRHDSYKRAKRLGENLPSYEAKYFLVIGIKKLIDSLSDENANEITEMLKRAEVSFGTHFIIVDSLQNFKSLWDHEWYKSHVTGIGGIWVGDGFENQTILDAARKPYENLSDEYGYLYQQGKLVLAKLLSVDAIEGEGDGSE